MDLWENGVDYQLMNDITVMIKRLLNRKRNPELGVLLPLETAATSMDTSMDNSMDFSMDTSLDTSTATPGMYFFVLFVFLLKHNV